HTDFLKKEASVTFNNRLISLRQVVETLAEIGYEPDLRLSDLHRKNAANTNRTLLYKIGVAGFCFGNIMMLSFPEYLTGVTSIEPALRHFFGFLNLLLALPVFFYSAGDYFINSWKAARQKYFSIDLPIALGLAAMLIRSTYEIISGDGAGYFDSMTGLVFFLLAGRYFQELTYKNLSFERDYKSYFPIAATVKKNGIEISTPISNLKPGDKIIIHSEELIPADAVLLNGAANIDYSFVTGEAVPVNKNTGDLIYAGAKQKGPAIELLVQKTVEQSYLTQLWNHDSFLKNKHATLSTLSDKISKYFTLAILMIALLTAIYWFPKDMHRGILACTAILIIACPCALAITVPFTFGNVIRILGRNNFYLKNAAVVESISKTNSIVFDKTGTVTVQQTKQLLFEGEALTSEEWRMIKSLTTQSIHPLSKKITAYLSGFNAMKVEHFTETPGAGIAGEINETMIRVGSADFISSAMCPLHSFLNGDTRVYVSINNKFAGTFCFSNMLREGLKEQVHLLQKDFQLFLLSGDKEGD
ncbi:MAG: HAD-IC family P-type ATPase, partial [Chitinophagales bacterium]